MHRLLIVDDDRMNIIVSKKFLSEYYIIDSCTSGKEAIQYLSSHMDNLPDLILLDVLMPEMDGFETMEVIKEIPYTNRIPVIFLTGDRTEETEIKCFELGAQDYIMKPFVPALMLRRIKRVLDEMDSIKSLEQAVQFQIQQLNNQQQEIIMTLANIIESRDGTTGEHVKRTQAYVDYCLKKLEQNGLFRSELTPKVCDYMRKAAPLHDIGKITIPDSILQKKGTLTDEEFTEMKNHAKNGGLMILKNKSTLGSDDFVKIAFEMATYHHEKWNGSGYPEGLKGTEIPVAARVLTVADVFDALSSKRSYKEILSFPEIMDLMLKQRGVGFQPEILDAFLSNPTELENLLMDENPDYIPEL